MKCQFCQNYEISQLRQGRAISIEDLAETYLKLQQKGAHNINLVTGCVYVPQIIESLKLAKENGLSLPILYNSSGYEKKETLQCLEGYVDCYLPDLKYYYDNLAQDLSGIPHYFETATEAIQEMYRQVGNPRVNEAGILQKGLLIRHLVLPNHLQNTKQVLKWLHKNISQEVYISVMAQYFPTYKALEREDINRKLTREEYNEILAYLEKLPIKKGYVQEIEENEQQYVPHWYT